MEAEVKSLSVILENEKPLKIPFFQRPYVWKYENVKLLLKDLIENDGKHFIGSLLFKNSTKLKETLIIDGQQRVTTLSLLIKALFETIKAKSEEVDYDTYTLVAINTLFRKKGKEEYLPKITHSYLDEPKFTKLIGSVEKQQVPDFGKVAMLKSDLRNQALIEIATEKDLEESKYSEKYNASNNLFWECYKYFIKEFDTFEVSKLENLWNQLFDEDNAILVLIKIDDNEQEQEIFDTINSSGIKLSPTDIIKNHLYEKMKRFEKSERKVFEYYQETWQKEFEIDTDRAKFWLTEKNIGRSKRSNIEVLFQAIGTIIGFYEVRGDTLSGLSKKFKDYIEKEIHDKNEYESFVTKIINYARIYRDVMPHFSPEEKYSFNSVHDRIALTLEKSENTTFIPLLIYLYERYEGKVETLEKKLNAFDSLIMHYLITEKSNKNFNKDCHDLIKNAQKSEADFDKYLSSLDCFKEKDILAGVKQQKKNLYAKIILFWIELHRKNAKEGSDSVGMSMQFTSTLELEHIMPQAWDAKNSEWLKVDFIDEKGNKITDPDEQKTYREQKIYSLGNMTLLSKKLNGTVKNKSFYKKINGDNSKAKNNEVPSMRTCSFFSITKEIIPEENLNENAPEYIWNELKITEREKKFAAELLSIWPVKK